MRRIPTFAAALSLTLASAAAAQESATTTTTTGTARIEERGGIEATGEVIFQDLLITPNIPLAVWQRSSAAVPKRRTP